MIENLDQIKKTIKDKEIKYIFCDYFDTLVTRKVHPEYIKVLTSKKIKTFFGVQNHSTESLYQLRLQIESRINEKDLSNGIILDFNIEEMYSDLFELLQNEQETFTFNYSKKDFIKRCIEIELEVERKNQLLDRDILNLLKEYKKQGLKIFLISDFYIPKDHFQTFLSNLEIDCFFDKIYVSISEGKSKRSGELYKQIINENNIIPEEVLMIGDNEPVDVDNARQNKLNAVFIDRVEHKKSQNDFLIQRFNKHKELARLKNDLKSIDKDNSEFYKFVYSLFIFSEKLYRELGKANTTDIFFLSREGQFLKKLFETFQNKLFLDNINTHYLIVSRRSTLLPSLNVLEKEDFHTIFRQYHDVSCVEFMKSLGFSDEKIENVKKDTPEISDHEKRLVDFKLCKEYQILRNSKEFKEIYEGKRSKQSELFQKYVSSFNRKDKSKIFIVDAGWKGTIQDHIFKALENIKTFGFYIGLLNPVKVSKDNIKKGLVFHDFPSNSEYLTAYSENHTLFEVLLAADHGSARSYEENEKGEVYAETENNPEEHELYEKEIKAIQDDFLKYFEQIIDVIYSSHIDTEDLIEFFATEHAKLMYNPSKKEINLYNSLYNFDNFGIFEKRDYKFFGGYRTKLKKLFKIIRKPKAMLKQETWPTVGLYNLGYPLIWRAYGYFRFKSVKR